MSSLITTHARAVANKAATQNLKPWDILSSEYNKCLTRKQKSAINKLAKKLLQKKQPTDAEANARRHEESLGEDF